MYNENAEQSDNMGLKENQYSIENLNENHDKDNVEYTKGNSSTTSDGPKDNEINTNPGTSTSFTMADPKACNPYKKSKASAQHGILHAIPQGSTSTNKSSRSGDIYKSIVLKKGQLRPQIHRYTPWIKIISSKSEEDE